MVVVGKRPPPPRITFQVILDWGYSPPKPHFVQTVQLICKQFTDVQKGLHDVQTDLHVQTVHFMCKHFTWNGHHHSLNWDCQSRFGKNILFMIHSWWQKLSKVQPKRIFPICCYSTYLNIHQCFPTLSQSNK